MFDWIFDITIWSSLLTLTILEIVLGIDNVIFLSIVSAKLPPEQQKKARMIGLALALIMRIVMLCGIAWIAGLTGELFSIAGHGVSGRDLILGVGGLFLLYKGTHEIHHTVEGHEEEADSTKKKVKFSSVIMQIVILDLVFSLDSVITAVGMTDNLPVMIAAVGIAILIMLVAAEPTAAFVQKHLSIKMLALSFLLLVGMALIADAAHFHIPREYLYVAIAFSMTVECLTLLAQKNRKKKAG
ncbi:MAG: TerC family protein [Alphaproteobacteria bacterium]